MNDNMIDSTDYYLAEKIPTQLKMYLVDIATNTVIKKANVTGLG